MSAAGRLLRAQMRDVDTPERAAERLRARRASLLAVADRVAMYPVLTIDNAQEAMAYQAERIAYHVAALDADAPPPRG